MCTNNINAYLKGKKMFTESFVLLKFVLSKSIFFHFLPEVLKMKTKIYLFFFSLSFNLITC